VPIYNGWRYYPNNKGLVSGIVLAGFGFGPFVFNYVSTALINPDNIEANAAGFFPPEVANNVPGSIRILCICWASIAVVGILMIFPYSEEDKQDIVVETEPLL
jgi:MFS transporter, OFA family, oxalate/formate antiporter